MPGVQKRPPVLILIEEVVCDLSTSLLNLGERPREFSLRRLLPAYGMIKDAIANFGRDGDFRTFQVTATFENLHNLGSSARNEPRRHGIRPLKEGGSRFLM